MTKHDLELTDFPVLAVRLKQVAENERSPSLEANQARELIADQTFARYRWIKDRPAFGGRTAGELQTEALKRRTADFLFATRDLWNLL